jgi:GNAT superfamily N-acetyltransferase
MKDISAPSAIIRQIRADELPALLELYRHLHADDPTLPLAADIEQLWQQILRDPSQHYLVAEVEGQIVASCVLVVIPNLTRSARPYGLIENVVTHPDFRKRGLGTQLLKAALARAWERNCYKVMLLTGRKDEATLRFYKQAGFAGGVKTGFVAKPRSTGLLPV